MTATLMSLYTVRDQQNKDFGTYTSREKAMRMASLLKNWFADRFFHVEELHIEPVATD